MFIDKVLKRNPALIQIAIDYHQTKKLLPDTYVVDVDTLINNAKTILNEAEKHGIKMYFMLKQLGRNPYLAKRLIEIGYHGAVVVDFKEAAIMMKHGIPISNVGHLVQPPFGMIQSLVDYGCEYFTVYSLEKIKDINTCAAKAGIVQKIMIRMTDRKDIVFSGQSAGFRLDQLEALLDEVQKLKHVKIAGLTSFPCFLYDADLQDIVSTENLKTIEKAKALLEAHGVEIENMNMPSTTCTSTIRKMAKYHASSGEPGHGLSGTTPLHAHQDCVELPCVIYLSEISHNYNGNAYCYGGGFYRRSHVKNALVGKDLVRTQVSVPSLESIDYYFGLGREFAVNDPVIMAFRFQIFVTRSDVCLIEGLHEGSPRIVGLYDSLGNRK